MSFKYLPGKVFFLNIRFVSPHLISLLNFDLVVYHYTLLALNYSHPNKLLSYVDYLSTFKGHKVAFPQDDYVNSYNLAKFFKLTGVEQIFTLFNKKQDIEKIYPINETGVDKINTVLPGYVSGNDIKYIAKKSSKGFNTLDISYRARKNPPWLGKVTFLKWKIAEIFSEKANHLKIDISTNESKVLLNNAWLNLMYSSRIVIGVEGGASIHDKYGILKKEFESNPNKDVQTYYSKYLKSHEGSIDLRCLTPRIFEAIVCKACLVLIEGDYSGVLKKNIHYIPIKNDFSNVEGVVNKINDKKLCHQIALKAYNDIIKSKKYSYENFISLVYNKIEIKARYASTPVYYNFLFFFLKNTSYILENIYYTLFKFKETLYAWKK